jgi:16S rRNA processing protein RimM
VLLDVGRIDRPHGVAGDVVVTLTTSETQRVAPGSRLEADGLELTVVRSRPLKRRWVVRFAESGSREDAEALAGTVLRAEPLDDEDDEDDEALWVHELVGAEVVDVDDRGWGRVVSVLDNPASDVLELDSGALVPLTFVTGWAQRPDRLRIDPPAGLAELVDGSADRTEAASGDGD